MVFVVLPSPKKIEKTSEGSTKQPASSPSFFTQDTAAAAAVIDTEMALAAAATSPYQATGARCSGCTAEARASSATFEARTSSLRSCWAEM